MRQNLKDLIATLAEIVPFPEPIVELGSFQVESQIGFADLRPFFPGHRYIGCDMRHGPGVDRLENMHHLTFADGSVGSILCLDTLEHVANCHLAVAEMHRVLAPGGLLVLASVMDFEIHEFPCDYWRFTPKAIEMLMRNFQPLCVYAQGNPLKPHTVLGIGRRGGESFPNSLDLRLATGQAEPFVKSALGLGSDADALVTYDAIVERQIAELHRALDDSQAELRAVHASTTWRLAVALRELPLVRGPLRTAVRWMKRSKNARMT